MFMTGALPDLYCDQLQADTAGQPFRQCGCCQAHPYRSERHTSKSRPRGHDIAFPCELYQHHCDVNSSGTWSKFVPLLVKGETTGTSRRHFPFWDDNTIDAEYMLLQNHPTASTLTPCLPTSTKHRQNPVYSTPMSLSAILMSNSTPIPSEISI